MMKIAVLILSSFLFLNAYADEDDRRGPPIRDVNVVNTPSVNVANAPDVFIANEPFVNVLSPALSAVQANGDERFLIGEGSKVASIYTVPPGKSLVIEYVSFNLFTSPISQQATADLQVCRSTPQISMGVLSSASIVFGEVNSFSQVTRLYAAENCEVRCLIARSNVSVEQNMRCQIIGHLVDN